VSGAARSTSATHDDGIEHLRDHRAIRYIGPADQCSDRNSAAVRENVAFYASFCAIRRVGPCEVPPFGAFTEALSSELHFQAMPRRPS
jgi:hypothetical protein